MVEANLRTHGMAKEATLSGAIKTLMGLLQNGLDSKRGDGSLHYAPLVADPNAAKASTTASGSAYSDGPFMLVARPGQEFTGKLEGLGAILVNQAHADIVPALREAIHAIRPDIIVEAYSGAGDVARQLNGSNSGKPASAPAIEGQTINRNWSTFAPESGTLAIPREQMPQIQASDRGAFVNFLNARGVEHQQEEVPADSLKPTQAEFSPKKVEHFAGNPSGRSILISQDGYVVDGHHQWKAARDAGQPVKVIRLDAPIQDLLRLAHQFPSSTTAKGPTRGNTDTGAGTADAGRSEGAGPADGRNDAGTEGMVQGQQQEQPGAAPTGPAVRPVEPGNSTAPAGPAGGNPALSAGQSVTLDGKPFTVRAAKKTAITLVDGAGKVRTIASNSPNWDKVKPAPVESAAPAAAAPAPTGPVVEEFAGQMGEGMAEHVAAQQQKRLTREKPGLQWTVAEANPARNPKLKAYRYVVEGRAIGEKAKPGKEAPAVGSADQAGAAAEAGVPATGSATVQADGVTAEQSQIRSQGLPKGLVEIHSARDTGALKAHPDYAAAKGGDAAAAVQVVRDLVSDGDITKAEKEIGPGALWVFPHAEEATGRNAIPAMLASRYAAATGGEVADPIVQSNRVFHTGADAMQRMIAPATFNGPVVPGARYVLVDDVSTMGSTLAALAHHIQSGGGKVVGAVTLANAGRAPTLVASKAQTYKIEQRHGPAIRELFQAEPGALTRDEASYVLGFRSTDELRNRAATAERERVDRLRAKGIPAEGLTGDTAAKPATTVAKQATPKAPKPKQASDKETRARADSTVDDFALGQSADQQLSGQNDLFGGASAAEVNSADRPGEQLRGGLPKADPQVEPEQNSALTEDQAKAALSWRDLGTQDSERRYALFFADPADGRSMQYGTVTIFKGSNRFLVDGGDGALSLKSAKSQAEALAVERLKRDGYVQEEAQTEAPAGQTKITDFGEKLEGARKDYAAALKDKMDAAESVDIASEPLSKSWPEPDYQKLLDAGADPFVVAWVRASRDEIPTKPQKGWKLKGWVASVQLLRDVSNKLMRGDISKAKLTELLADQKYARVAELVGGRAELYELVGHERSLKGITLQKHHYAMYRGENNVTKWAVEQKAKASTFSNWPNEIAVANTKAEVLAQFQANLSKLDKAKDDTAPKGSFDIYRKRGQTGAFIGKKIGREHVDLKSFPDVAAARLFLADHTAELQTLLEKYKETPLERKAENQPRVGEDHRNGAPVTPEAFQEAFGFRGVQFGNYVEGARRQSDLNQSYDALMDMAAVLGIPPRAISLNGQLGLAFGARGAGGKNAAAAHYEQGKVVINLTKGSGPGSLGHEWWHALDNYFAKQAGETGYVTGDATGNKLRDEMRASFMAIKKAIAASGIKDRSQQLDNRRSKPYWATGHEMAARSFESYIIAKLQDQSAANDYLANIVDQQVWDTLEQMQGKSAASYPYPSATELPGLRAAFDEFFQKVQTKTDDAGNVALMSRPQPGSPEANALQALSQNDDLFALPKSAGNTVEQITKDNDPGIKVQKITNIPGETRYNFTLPSGKTARMMVREANPYGPSTYGFDQANGESGNVQSERPGVNPEDVDPSKGDVWIDVSLLTSGIDGRAIYNIASTYAHNTGRIFIGDPAGLSDEAMIRRPEQMLSSALKFGTTEHLAPHPRQVQGDPDLGIPPLKWVYGDDIGNIRRLIDLNLKVQENAGADAITYDPATGQFIDSAGQPIDRAGLAELAAAGYGRSSLAGGKTLARGSILRALSREEGSAVEGQDGGRSGLLDRLVRQSAVHPQATNGVFYSRSGTASTAAGLSVEQVQSVADALTGEGFKIQVVANRDELSPEQLAAVKTADPDGIGRGAYLPDGTIVLFADRLDSQAEALAVALHEGFHRGLAATLGPEASRVLAQVYKTNAKVRAAADAYVSEYKLSRDDATNEALADMAMAGTAPKLNYWGSVKKAVRDFLRRVADKLGLTMEWTDADIAGFVASTSKRGLKGGAHVDGGGAMASRKTNQTMTEAFRKWFGDSKVVDAEGKPLVVYHGTRGDFTTFDYSKIGEQGRAEGAGFYFTNNKQVAGGYGKPLEVYLNLQNPLRYDAKGFSRQIVAKIVKRVAEIEAEREGSDIAEGFLSNFGDVGHKGLSSVITEAARMVHADETALDQLSGIVGSGVNPEYVNLATREVTGHDGVVADGFSNSGDTQNKIYVAFFPEQIKSATGNRGTFDPNDASILMSRPAPAAAATAQNPAQPSVLTTPTTTTAPAGLPTETTAQLVQRKIQDNLNRFNVLRDWLTKQGVQLTDSSNVWEFEERMHGRIATRVEDFREQTVKPIIKEIQKAGFTMEQAGQYLHAQHAQERNEQIEKIDPANQAGSGMTTADANAILASADPELARLANKLQAITHDSRSILLNAGIITHDQANAWQAAYKSYVPLKGEGDPPSQTGKGLNVSGRVKRALGHGARDEYIVENILRDHERAIALAEKNTVGHSLLRFIMESGRPEIATIGQPEKRKVLAAGASSYEVQDPTGAAVQAFTTFDDAMNYVRQQVMNGSAGSAGLTVRQVKGDPFVKLMARPMLADNEVQVYVNGSTVRVQINDPLLARAYAKMGIESLNKLLRINKQINSWLSHAYTGYNPEFLLTNIARDMTTGVLNTIGKFGAGVTGRTLAAYPKAFAQMLAYSYTGKASALVADYRKAGGSTGAAYLPDIERIGADIKNSFEDYQGALAAARAGKPLLSAKVAGRKVIKGLGTLIEHLNAAGENAMRVAVFDAVRTTPGMTVNDAASAAKNATVNFNRRGEWSQAAGGLYLFFNPALQGSGIFLHTMLKGRHRAQAWAILAGMTTAAYLLRSMQWDDDEGKKLWAKIPKYVKEHNVIIRTGGESWVNIPIPYDYGFFFTLGNHLHDLQQGAPVGETAQAIALDLFNSMSPIDPFGDEPSTAGAVELVPGLFGGELMRAGARVIANRNSFGGQIVPESSYDTGKPDSQKLYRTTKGTAYAKVAEGINSLTGGTKTQPGMIDVSPETLKFWTNTLTGGLGKFLMDSAHLGTLGLEAAKTDNPDERAALKPDMAEIPMLRRFSGETSVKSARGAFWPAAKQVDEAIADMKRAKKAHDADGENKAAQQEYLISLGSALKAAKNSAKAARDQADEIMADDTKSLAYKRAAVKAIEAQEIRVYDDFLAGFEATRQEHQKRMAKDTSAAAAVQTP